MKKTKPAAKSAKKLSIRNRTKTPSQVKRKKTKKSTLARYGARVEKRKAWAEKNPDMIPGDIGKQATPKVTDAQVVEAVSAAPFETQSIDPDETVPGPDDKLTAVEEADKAKFDEKMSVGVTVSDALIMTDGVSVKMVPKTGPRGKVVAVDVTSQLGDRVDDSLE